MKNKKKIVLGIGLFLSIFLVGVVSASFCCEKTVEGAWCQQIEAESGCASGFNVVPTSCEATSYCRLGVCINGLDGICIPNTPERVCSDNGGLWDERSIENIGQCKLGCCVLGEEVAFVTQVRCEQLSSIYGLTPNYLPNIQSELQCLASANPSVRGACEYEEDYQKRCSMTTKGECSEDATFHEGYLCSAPVLENICAPRGGTTCVDGKDEVYFLDTCGNLANVYDSIKKDDDNNYWTYIQEPTCGDGSGNKESASCGNCDYLAGSTCAAETGASYGDHICIDLDCTDYENADEGFSGATYPKHGEIWCADSKGVGEISVITDAEGVARIEGGEDHTQYNLPGSRYFKRRCFNGEVSVEPCADYRQEVCVQSETSISDGSDIFRYAVCRKPQWEDCIIQIDSDDCLNREERDCKWIEQGYCFSDTGLRQINTTLGDPEGICVPLYAPGFDEENDGGMCAMASSTCIVTYEGGLFDKDEIEDIDALTDAEKLDFCSDNCYCSEGYIRGTTTVDDNDEDLYPFASYGAWVSSINNMCTALGDCGDKNNLIGEAGEGIEVVVIPAAEITEEETTE